MEFKTIETGSSGNAYLLQDGEESILIEAGIPWKRIQKAMDFNTRGVRFCLISHGHGDHVGHMKDVLKAGIDCWMPKETALASGLLGKMHRIGIMAADGRTYEPSDGWFVRPFEVTHDVQCFGYLIAKGDDRFAYLTDCLYSPVRFVGLTDIALGINYSRETLSDDIHPVHRRHIISSHLELSTALDILKANDLSRCRAIHLIHLSAHNSDAEHFRSEVQRATGVPTYA